MSIAEDLYTAGYITYPRTDNTVYPEDLEPRDLLDEFVGSRTFGDDAESLLEREDIEPTAGEEETTDHPPIHPTGELPSRTDISEDEWEVYELVVRRFFATVAEAAEWEHLRVVAVVGEDDPLTLKANGKRLVRAGYHEVYPYYNSTENIVPDVQEGEELRLTDARLEAKQTQPPRRYGQSRLIETMEKMGIGTKATRHDVIQKLYDRGYIESDPPRPTRLAFAVVEAGEEFADRIVSEDMTAQLEADMEAIAAGEKSLDEVTAESREMLEAVFEALTESREAVGDHLQKSLKADKTLGPCPECGDDLLVRKSRHGSYFVGCNGYPDCTYTLPLPSTGKPLILEETCEEHGLREVKMLAGRKTFVHGCPQCKADDADDADDVIIGACPECGEGAASEAPRDGDGEAVEAEEGGELAIKHLRSGSRLVGCTRYPDCEYSLPLPRRGDVEVTEEECDEHGLPHLRITYEDGEPWELGCPICNYREYQAQQNGSELEAIEGIGEKTAAKLKEAGIENVKGLKDAEADDVAERVDGVSPDTVRQWQAKAD
jgi:DNA topoisomerase-1